MLCLIMKRRLEGVSTSQTEKEPEQKRLRREEVGMEDAQRGTQAKAVGRPMEVDEVEQEEVAKRRRMSAGIWGKWKQRKSSQLTSEEIAQRRRVMLYKVELDFVDEEL
jgi:hypothetical protein